MSVSDNKRSQFYNLIAPSALKVNPSSLQIGSKLARTIFIFSYPRYLTTNWLSPIVNLDKELDISFYIAPTDNVLILKKLRKKTAQISAQISENERNSKVRDPILEIALHDIEELRDNLQQGITRFFKFAIYITFYGDSEDDLNKTENELRAMLEVKMVYFKPAAFQHEEGFFSIIPTSTDRIQVYNSMDASPISSTFPFVSFDLSSNKGILYGINRHNNSLILFDRFTLENANTVVFAKSGAGKSYAVKLEILRSLMMGIDVLVIDPENEYRYLAETVGGTLINISLNSVHSINPFDLPIPQEDDNPANILRSNIINLVGLIRIMLGGLTPEEDSLLDKALNQVYASRDITPESDFSKISPPIMSDLHQIIKNMEGGQSIANRMEKFVSGTYSSFFNQQTNVKLTNKMVVFNIRDMEEELRPIAMYVVLHYIWNIIRSERKKRILAIDEAWVMMKYEDAASFLFSIAKRCRKYWMGLTTITQDIPDFLRSKYGKPVLTNSSLQFLFKQSPAAIDIVKETFNLTEQEKYLLLECNVGEGLFFAGTKHVALKVIASYTEDQIITSDPAQLAEIEKAKQEFNKNLEEKTTAQSANTYRRANFNI